MKFIIPILISSDENIKYCLLIKLSTFTLKDFPDFVNHISKNVMSYLSIWSTLQLALVEQIWPSGQPETFSDLKFNSVRLLVSAPKLIGPNHKTF